jgi:predicted nucleotidyltransferase
MSKDIIGSMAGNKMGQLKQEIIDLKALLKKQDDEDKIKELKKLIMEKETNYNILAERARMR